LRSLRTKRLGSPSGRSGHRSAPMRDARHASGSIPAVV